MARVVTAEPAGRTPRRRWPSVILAVGSLALTVLIVEVVGRLAGIDYEFKAYAFRRHPIFYQQPTLPVGPFFRRPGPAEWHGKVISTVLRLRGYRGADVGDPEVAVTYDRDGFRNPETLTDWDIVVAGDSFTEAGYLAYDDLFTTILGTLVHRRVKNLGLSYTGTLAQTLFLERFGKSPSTAHGVVAFFEGNDPQDVQREAARKATPRLPRPAGPPVSVIDALPRQSSFVRALCRWVAGAWQHRHAPPPAKSFDQLVTAEFVGGRTPVGLTLSDIPPAPAQMDAALRDLVDGAIAAWGNRARALGLTPWLLYIPCKRRALDGLLRFTPRTPPRFVRWSPNDLPRWIDERCAAHGVRFVDATPALAADARAGVLPYNAIYDSHLNQVGHRTVARVLADALGPALAEHPP